MINTNSCITKGARFTALMAVALLLAGCGGGGTKPAQTAMPTVTPDATPTLSVPQAGGTIQLPMPEGVDFGNPLLPATREMSSLYGLVFESLVTFDDSGTPVPCLAEKWDLLDGTKWTFRLRPGVQWHGTNRTLAASDVVFTLDQIKALGADKPWGYVLDYLKSWQANDDGTLTIELNTPFYGALHALTFPVLPADGGYNNNGFPAKPIGTGPYVVDKLDQKQSIELSVNTNWWKKAPYISKITVKPYPDNATEISSLVLRGLDAMQTDDLTVTQYRESGDAHVYEYPTRYFEFMALNFTSPDIQNKLIRQAIAYAIDRREIVSYTYVNHAIVSDSPVPPDSWLYQGRLLQYNSSVEQARRLIKLAGWKDNQDETGQTGKTDDVWDTSPDGVNRPLKLTLLTNRDDNNTLRNDAANQIKSQLEKAGFQVDVDAEGWDDYNNKIKEKRFDLALCGCYLSPVPDYRFLLGTGGKLNVGGYSSSAMDALLDDIMKAPKSEALKVKISSLQEMIIDELPIISLYFRTHTLLTAPDMNDVKGAREDSAFDGISEWYKR